MRAPAASSPRRRALFCNISRANWPGNCYFLKLQSTPGFSPHPPASRQGPNGTLLPLFLSLSGFALASVFTPGSCIPTERLCRDTYTHVHRVQVFCRSFVCSLFHAPVKSGARRVFRRSMLNRAKAARRDLLLSSFSFASSLGSSGRLFTDD